MDGENKDLEKATALMDEADELQKEYDLEARMYAAEKKIIHQQTKKYQKKKQINKKKCNQRSSRRYQKSCKDFK